MALPVPSVPEPDEPMGSTENIKALLGLYIFPDGGDRSTVLANQKRIEGIKKLSIRTANRLASAAAHARAEHRTETRPRTILPGPGDMYLFGAVMDHFLGMYSSINCFTQLRVIDAIKGDAHLWPARTGDRPLI